MFSHPQEKIKSLFYHSEKVSAPSSAYVPHLLIEAKIDINDVRSGLHETQSLSRAMALNPVYTEVPWTGDMLLSLDPELVDAIFPSEVELEPLPPWVDKTLISGMENQFVHFLLRQHKVRIFRNFALKSYSAAGEGPEEFINRCIESLKEPFSRELACLSEVYNRRLEQIKQKFLLKVGQDSFELAKTSAARRDLMHVAAEKVEELFSKTALTLDPPQDLPPPDPSGSWELEDRLNCLQVEASRAIGNLMKTYQEKARNIDEFVLHPTLKSIHLVRTCILWMPAK
jgi:hypothetical protein